jgi:hypothetical protein
MPHSPFILSFFQRDLFTIWFATICIICSSEEKRTLNFLAVFRDFADVSEKSTGKSILPIVTALHDSAGLHCFSPDHEDRYLEAFIGFSELLLLKG